jgi:hypothetical protein
MESRMDRIERNLEKLLQIMAESNAKSEKEWAEFRKGMAQSEAKSEKEWTELRALQAENAVQIAKLQASQAETDRLMRRLEKKLEDQGFVQGEVAEDLFYRNVRYLFENKMKFGNVVRNLKKPGTAEFDIVAFNDDKVLVVEVKNKLVQRMVDDFVERRLPKFRKVFPEYAHCRLIGGMGSLVVKDEVGEYAERAGLYVLTQKGDGGATLINRKHFRPKVF